MDRTKISEENIVGSKQDKVLLDEGNNMNTDNKIILRKASMEDAELLFQWKNDKATIENSISKRGVTMEEHLKWLENVIDNPMRQLFILDVNGVSVGQLRLDLESADKKMDVCQRKDCENPKEDKNRDEFLGKKEWTAEISYGLGAEHRGKGLGKVLLEQAETLADMFEISTLIAEVLPHNIASQRLFKKMGFEEEQKDNFYVYRKRYE